MNREEASRRFDYRLNSAENFAKNNGISLNLAFWLTCFSDSEARLIAYLDFQNISKPVSLDRGRSDSDKRDGYNFNPAKSTDQEATEAKLRLGKIIKASGLSEEDLEALMSEIVDGGIGVDSLSKRSSELLEALREAAR